MLCAEHSLSIVNPECCTPGPLESGKGWSYLRYPRSRATENTHPAPDLLYPITA